MNRYAFELFANAHISETKNVKPTERRGSQQAHAHVTCAGVNEEAARRNALNLARQELASQSLSLELGRLIDVKPIKA